MQIRTTRFGSVSIDESQIVTFPEGLPGFETTRQFVFLPHPGDLSGKSPFKWLQCVDEASGTDSLAFPVIDPWLIDPDYTPTIPSPALQELHLEQMQGRAQLWAVVTVPHDQPEDATANLLAPLLINRELRLGRQVALLGEKFHLRTPLKSASARHRETQARRMSSHTTARPLAVAVG